MCSPRRCSPSRPPHARLGELSAAVRRRAVAAGQLLQSAKGRGLEQVDTAAELNALARARRQAAALTPLEDELGDAALSAERRQEMQGRAGRQLAALERTVAGLPLRPALIEALAAEVLPIPDSSATRRVEARLDMVRELKGRLICDVVDPPVDHTRHRGHRQHDPAPDAPCHYDESDRDGTPRARGSARARPDGPGAVDAHA